MAKYCTNCGREMREDDKFCAECGTPVSGAVSTPALPQQPYQPLSWEYCTIKASWKGGWTYRGVKGFFYGEATGPSGIYMVARSREWQDKDGDTFRISSVNRDMKAVLSEFVQTLVASGWELIPEMGRVEWEYTFRRPVS